MVLTIAYYTLRQRLSLVSELIDQLGHSGYSDHNEYPLTFQKGRVEHLTLRASNNKGLREPVFIEISVAYPKKI